MSTAYNKQIVTWLPVVIKNSLWWVHTLCYWSYFVCVQQLPIYIVNGCISKIDQGVVIVMPMILESGRCISLSKRRIKLHVTWVMLQKLIFLLTAIAAPVLRIGRQNQCPKYWDGHHLVFIRVYTWDRASKSRSLKNQIYLLCEQLGFYFCQSLNWEIYKTLGNCVF